MCVPIEQVDAHNQLSKTSVTAVHLIRVRVSRRSAASGQQGAQDCLLTLRTLAETSSRGHKFKVLGLLFAELSDNKWQPPGTHVDPAWMFDLAPPALEHSRVHTD